MKVYIASLTDYNHGILYGKWIDLEGKDLDELMEEVEEMLSKSPTAEKYGEVAEEWDIHDTDGPSEMRDLELDELIEFAEACDTHGQVAFCAYLSNVSDLDYAIEHFEEAYCGEYKDFLEYAEQLMDECYDIPENIAPYIDYEAFARDLSADGYYEDDGHVFRPV